ncbi:endonuclease [Candidatus Micrarchaeota archaeon]|nr:endonuclease [Candidatus Micrarchaeota archaeon]MBU1166522.1 endonuclease [Candidatus Micrarchaeota archaeon]MBU1887534.1 endonuclease [Candidatus Micrarchaeota archaeon]
MQNKRVFLLYDRLLEESGPQNWWPAETPYEVVVGAILTQNTNWKNVEKAIANLKKENLLNESSILKTENQELETLIRSSGFYRQKAERLKLATKKWIELQNRKDKLQLNTPELREEWLSVKGIGKETADSILLYAMDHPIFVIDAYTRRFCKAEFGLEFGVKDYDDCRMFFEKNLPKENALELFKEYHALIVEWGKRDSHWCKS